MRFGFGSDLTEMIANVADLSATFAPHPVLKNWQTNRLFFTYLDLFSDIKRVQYQVPEAYGTYK